MGIAVLGPLLVDDHAALSPRDQVVLEALVATGGTALSAGSLAEALWGESPPASWRKLIPSSILRIRKVLGSAAIETTSHGYRLAAHGDTVDAVRFVHLVERGHQLLTAGDPDRARHVLREALGLWRGRALAEILDWEPGRFEAERLDEVRREAEEAVLDASLRAGRHAETVAEARSRVAQEPLRERRWALLALAQYLAGDQADALETLRQARRRLADELGLDPGAEIARLEDAILRQDASLVAAVALPEPAPECPYPGLRAFDVDDGDVFFGRRAELDQCLSRLTEQGVLVVAGPSGSGKSSLVRAGVVASLRSTHQRVEVLGPGPDTLVGLRDLVGARWRGAVVVDQLEEVLAACGPGERDDLDDALLRHTERGPLIMTLRADHLADVAGHPGMSRIVERGLYLLGPMTADSLRAAIEGPAREAALTLEPGLVDVLLGEVLDAPGALPLMAHALEQTWQRREGRTLTLAGYRDSGGIDGAVAQTAEGVFDGLGDDDRTVLRDLLRRLVSVTPDGDPVRVWVPVRRLPEDGSRDLVELLVRARLLAVDDDAVAVAHESLARAWPRLRAWLEEDVEGRHVLRHLSAAADSWDGLGRPQSELYRGVRLRTTLEWRARGPETLTPTEQAFLDASREAERVARHREAMEEAHRRRRDRTTRALVAGVVTLVLVAVTAGGVAVLQRNRAGDAAVARWATTAAAAAHESSDPTTALLAGVEAVRLRDGADTRGALLRALTRWPGLLRSRVVPPTRAIAVGVDGHVIVGGDRVSVLDPSSLAEVASVEGAAHSLRPLVDGRRLLTGTESGTVSIVDLGTGKRVTLLTGQDTPVWGAQTSVVGGVVAVALYHQDRGTSEVAMWRGTTRLPSLPRRPLHDFALSPKGDRIYARVTAPEAIVVHDVATGRLLASRTLAEMGMDLPRNTDEVDSLAVSPDGGMLALGAGEVILLDTATLSVRARLRNPSEGVVGLAFSPDGRVVASGSADRTVTLWDVTGLRRERIEGLSEGVADLAFSRDGRALHVLTADHRLSAWDLSGERQLIQNLRPGLPEGRLEGDLVVPAPDGEVVAYMSPTVGADDREERIDFLDVTTGRLLEPVLGTYQNWGVWRPPDAERLAVPGDRTIRVWDWRRRSVALEKEVGEGPIEALAYTPDGARLVVGERSGHVFQVDASTLARLGARVSLEGDLHEVIWAGEDRALAVLGRGSATVLSLVDLRAGTTVQTRTVGVDVSHADVSPDGRLLALGGMNGEVGLLDLDTGVWAKEPVREHQGSILRVDFSSDGRLLVSSGGDGRVRLWHGRTGEAREGTTIGRVGIPSSAVFEPDGHTVVLAAGDGTVRRWDTRVSSWQRLACEKAGRSLTSDEWALIFGGQVPYHATCARP